MKDKAQAIATFGGTINAESMDALPEAQIVADERGRGPCRSRRRQGARYPPYNAPDVLTDDASDIAIALLLNVARRNSASRPLCARGETGGEGRDAACDQARRPTMGVLGLGRIGMAVAKRAEALGVRSSIMARAEAGRGLSLLRRSHRHGEDADYLMISCPGGDGDAQSGE